MGADEHRPTCDYCGHDFAGMGDKYVEGQPSEYHIYVAVGDSGGDYMHYVRDLERRIEALEKRGPQ